MMRRPFARESGIRIQNSGFSLSGPGLTQNSDHPQTYDTLGRVNRCYQLSYEDRLQVTIRLLESLTQANSQPTHRMEL